MMKCLISPSNSCYFNIASEEYYLKNFDEDVFYLYVNAPCIVVGKHQNTYAEINHEYVRENGIGVVRRNSGGGAVYHDMGNLNYGFITQHDGKNISEVFQEFTAPILSVLHSLGVNAVFSGRNDLTIDGKKFSGNAQFHANGRVLIHGTLLFSSNLEQVSQALQVDPRKFEDKSVKSVRSRVTNILPYLPAAMDVHAFTEKIFNEMLAMFPGAFAYELTKDEQTRIQSLADVKYSSWEWVYGHSPRFTYTHTLKYECGLLDVGILVESGRIQDIAIYGDFFGECDIDDLLDLLRGQPFDKDAVCLALENVLLSSYIFGLSGDMLIDCLFSEKSVGILPPAIPQA